MRKRMLVALLACLFLWTLNAHAGSLDTNHQSRRTRSGISHLKAASSSTNALQSDNSSSDKSGRSHRREIPGEAISACSGKPEGASCTVGKGGTGVCAYTPDKKYFACKPNGQPWDDGKGNSSSENTGDVESSGQSSLDTVNQVNARSSKKHMRGARSRKVSQ